MWDDEKKLSQMVVEIDQQGEDLTPWEVEFISRLVDGEVLSFTSRQAEQIKRIHEERVPQ